jgi:hypothetical protein
MSNNLRVYTTNNIKFNETPEWTNEYGTSEILHPEYYEYIILNQESFNPEYIERDINSIYEPDTYHPYFVMKDTYLEIHTNTRPYSEYAKLPYNNAQDAILTIT